MTFLHAFSRAFFVAIVLVCGVGVAAEVGGPVEVAPQAQGSRSQGWAALAWNESANCWLVAWREGYLNEPDSDIWCARVSVDGGVIKALDPAGIRVTGGKGLKDRPRLACDGKGFLVVWEDLGNGKDWDVLGARVSAEGKLLDEKPVLIAAGGNNQCRPDVTFAGGHYLVVWQNYRGDGESGQPGTGYVIYGARISDAGKVLDAVPIDVASLATHQVFEPSVVARGDEALVTCTVLCGGIYKSTQLGRRVVDARTGQPKGPPISNARNPQLEFNAEQQRAAALAAGPNGALVVLKDSKKAQPHALALWLMNEKWDFSGGNPIAVGQGGATVFSAATAAAFDGMRYLVAMDWGDSGGSRTAALRVQVRGWHVAPDGKVADDPAKGFVIAAEAGKDQMLPAVAAGPRGVCLVVYSEVRGADDMKLLARLVK